MSMYLKTSIEVLNIVKAPSSVLLKVTVFNMNGSRAYNVWANIYINDALTYTPYYNIVEPGGWELLTWSFIVLNPGVYKVEVKVSYVSSEYAKYESLTTKIVHVKRDVTVTVTSGKALTQSEIPEIGVKDLKASVELGDIIMVKGLINPPGVYDVILETSIDSFIWTPILTLKSDNMGVFMSKARFNVTGLLLLRARVPETEVNFEALSNIIIVHVKEKPKDKVEAAPLKVTLTADKTSIHVAQTVKLQVKVEPPLNLK